jgi:exopolysaccharide biosynthesis polyprenyl glycosylphosphotransferase
MSSNANASVTNVSVAGVAVADGNSLENTQLHLLPRLVHQSVWKMAYQAALLISDALMLLLGFALAYWLRFYGGIPVFQNVIPSMEHYMRLVLILIPVWLGLFALLRLYDFHILLSGTTEYSRALNGCTSGMMIVVAASFIVPEFIIARAWLLMSWIFSTALVSSNRWFLRRLAHALRQQGWFLTPALIVGTNAEAISLANQLRNSMYSGFIVLGFIDEKVNVPTDQRMRSIIGLPVLGTIDDITTIVHERKIEEIVVATTALSREQLLSTSLNLSGIPGLNLSLSSGLYEIFTTGMKVSTRNAVPLMSFNRMRLDPMETALKAALDYSIVLLASLLLLPLISILALAVKLDSPGPILYRRRVLGVSGKEFDAFKFRTMHVNGDEILAQHPELLAELRATHKLKVDPRITRVGKLLRRTSLDELPQFINILLGQMSLVGPRMISPAEAEMYGQMRQNLLTVKPGLTGLWQVSGRSDLSYNDRVQLDMQYIRNYSIWLDLQILFFQTLPAVLKGSGAY